MIMSTPSRSLFVAVAGSLVLSSDAFAPSSLSRGTCFTRPLVRKAHLDSRGLWVSLSTIDDIIGATEDDDDDDLLGVDEDKEPEDFLLSADDLEGEDESTAELPDDLQLVGEDGLPLQSQRLLHLERLTESREKYRRHETDTGSPEFQVAGMTERISYLTKHLRQHPKDFSTRRGLVALVNKRRRLLNYLARESPQRYTELIASLGVRHRAPSKVQSRAEQYGRFPPQKANSGKSKVKKMGGKKK